MQNPENRPTYKCPLCPVVFDQINPLKKHWHSIHHWAVLSIYDHAFRHFFCFHIPKLKLFLFKIAETKKKGTNKTLIATFSQVYLWEISNNIRNLWNSRDCEFCAGHGARDPKETASKSVQTTKHVSFNDHVEIRHFDVSHDLGNLLKIRSKTLIISCHQFLQMSSSEFSFFCTLRIAKNWSKFNQEIEMIFLGHKQSKSQITCFKQVFH